MFFALGIGVLVLSVWFPWVQSAPSEKYPLCKDIVIKVSASANLVVAPDFGDLSAAGSLIAAFSRIPQVLANATYARKSGEYNISGTFCEPTKKVPGRENHIQLLVHGATYTKEYWSTGAWSSYNSPEYSWTRYANEKGYYTLALDRLGNGQSSRPDPLQEVQLPLEADAIHQIIRKLREGALLSSSLSGLQTDRKFTNIIYVGHSLGSIAGTIVAQNYPKDIETLVLTGYSADGSNAAILAVAEDYRPAHDILSRFSNLPEYYLTTSQEKGVTTAFYYGSYDLAIAPLDFESRGTLAFGELFAFGIVPTPNYQGNVLVVTGDHDQVFCGPGNPSTCLPAEQSPVAKAAGLFPNAKSFSYFLGKNDGHDLNFHTNARDIFRQVHKYLRKFHY